jgi:hypothetical protein
VKRPARDYAWEPFKVDIAFCQVCAVCGALCPDGWYSPATLKARCSAHPPSRRRVRSKGWRYTERSRS